MLMKDLWPEEIKAAEILTPVAIVRQQGEILGERTRNLLLGKVRETRVSVRSAFSYSFNIVAPTMSYEYELFEFEYGLDLYPVIVKVEEEIGLDVLRGKRSGSIAGPLRVIEAASEDEFLDLLKAILNARKTRKLISTLLAQIQTSAPASELPPGT